MSFPFGVFPKQLKIGKAIPVHESGSKIENNNYRLISILSVISKVFEKATAYRLRNYLDKHNLVSNCQFGFRENMSTQSALLNFVSMIYVALDCKSPVVSVL